MLTNTWTWCLHIALLHIALLDTALFHYYLQTEAEEAVLNKKRSKSTQKKYDERKKTAKVENALEEQFASGRVLGKNYDITCM